MATNLETLFINAINEATKAAKMLTDPAPRANAYAAIAQAIASTGLIGQTTDIPEAPAKAPAAETPKAPPATGKDSLKPAASKTAAPAAQEAPAAPAPEEAPPAQAPEAEYPDVWNDETIAMFADEIAFMNQVKEAYGPETMDSCVQDFSTNQLQTLSEITPHNIKAFVYYIEAMIKAAEEEEQA